MLSGEYNFLVDNMWLAEIIAVLLLIIPFFLFFADKKWIFGYYVASIVANLPLIFVMVFEFPYEIIVALVAVASLIRDAARNKNFLFLYTKESRNVFLSLCGLLALNLVSSFFHFSQDAFIARAYIYLTNLFILVVFSLFLVNRNRLQVLRFGFVIGALILVVSMIVELVYGYRHLGVGRLRPGGLLLDPNVAAFALNLSLLISFYQTKRTKLLLDLFFIASRIIIVFGIFMTVSRSGYILTLLLLSAFLVEYSRGKKRHVAPITVGTILILYLTFYKTLNKAWDNLYLMLDLQRVFPKAQTGPELPGPAVPGNLHSESRFELLVAGVKVFLNNFSVGVGIGNVTAAVEELTGMRQNTHNLVLQLLCESGIFMLVMLLVLFYYLVNLIGKSEKKERFFLSLILLVVVVESFFNHNMLNINIVYLLLAFYLALNVLHSKEQRAMSLGQIKNRFRK